MGLAIDTNETHPLIPADDDGKPNPRTFFCRYPSYRDFNRIEALFKEADSASGNETAATIIQAIQIVLVGWKNVGIDFVLADADAVFSLPDLLEIRARLLDELTMGQMDKKKLSLRSRFATASSANATATAAANAPQSNPSPSSAPNATDAAASVA